MYKQKTRALIWRKIKVKPFTVNLCSKCYDRWFNMIELMVLNTKITFNFILSLLYIFDLPSKNPKSWNLWHSCFSFFRIVRLRVVWQKLKFMMENSGPIFWHYPRHNTMSQSCAIASQRRETTKFSLVRTQELTEVLVPQDQSQRVCVEPEG